MNTNSNSNNNHHSNGNSKGRRGRPPLTKRPGEDHYNNSSNHNHNHNHNHSSHGAFRSENTVCSGTSSKRSTPSSVMVGSTISRELSDLSGSYMHGNPAYYSSSRSSASIPRHIRTTDSHTSLSSIHKPWRQAYVLSKSDRSVAGTTSKGENQNGENDSEDDSLALILVERTGGVELVQRPNIDDVFPMTLPNERKRTPLIILLSDHSRRQYEIMQLWIDHETDSVRSVLQSVRQSVPDRWRHDYDGLIQIRAGKPSQLIHVLSVKEYDARPYEIMFAKPWAMAAKLAGHHALALLEHLRSIGVATSQAPEGPDGGRTDSKSTPVEDTMVLSVAARSRVPPQTAILTHLHASQFLSFSPPFETSPNRHREPNDAGRSSNSSTGMNDAGDDSRRSIGMSESEESQEVITLSSYSHLNALDPLLEKEPVNVPAVLVPAAEAATRAERGLSRPQPTTVRKTNSSPTARATAPTKTNQHLKSSASPARVRTTRCLPVQSTSNDPAQDVGPSRADLPSMSTASTQQQGRLKGLVGSVSKLLSPHKPPQSVSSPLASYDRLQRKLKNTKPGKEDDGSTGAAVPALEPPAARDAWDLRPFSDGMSVADESLQSRESSNAPLLRCSSEALQPFRRKKIGPA